MNSKLTRRETLAGVGIGCIGITAGCMGDNDEGGGGGNGGLGTNTIESVDFDAEDNEVVVSVIDDHNIGGVRLYDPDGERVTLTGIDPVQTEARLRFQGTLENEPYNVVAYDENEPMEEYEWIPTLDVDLVGVETAESDVGPLPDRSSDSHLEVTFENNGDVAANIESIYISDGFPVDYYDQDQVGSGGGQFQRTSDQTTATIAPDNVDQGLFEDGNQECGGRTDVVEITAEIEGSDPITQEVEVTLDGEYVEQDGFDPAGCGNVSVELID